MVVRSRIPGQTGPSGGPAATDVLGECVAWEAASMTVLRESGEEVTIPLSLIVSGKPVPPRPSVRGRVSPAAAQARSHAMFTDVTTAPLGGWLVRWSGATPARRVNSVLAMDESGLADPVGSVVERYAALGRPPIAAVLPGSSADALFTAAGWVLHREEADAYFQIAGVAACRRNLAEPPSYGVELTDLPSRPTVERVEATIGEDAHAIGAYEDDWLGISGVWVNPERRRRGLGLAVIARLLGWGAELGATTTYLQVLSDNEPALTLYARLGFTPHHTYRYLTPPS